jgi:hypothetical protein
MIGIQNCEHEHVYVLTTILVRRRHSLDLRMGGGLRIATVRVVILVVLVLIVIGDHAGVPDHPHSVAVLLIGTLPGACRCPRWRVRRESCPLLDGISVTLQLRCIGIIFIAIENRTPTHRA